MPGARVAHLTHGQVIEVLIANRLTSPAPLVEVGDWARTWAMEEVFGIEAGLLNDDRLARALDAVAPHLEEIVGSVGARAIAEFGIDTARCHWDMTSVSVHDAYPESAQDEEYPQVKYGHPKDRRVDLRQVQAGLGVAADGGIPVHARVFSGGAGEVAQVVDAMKALKTLASERRMLLVSYPNLAALLASGVDSVAPAPAAPTPDTVFAALDPARATTVDYTPDREAGLPAEQRGTYHVTEDVMEVAGPRKKDPVLTLRRVLVHSSGDAAGQRQAREKRLAKAAEELDKVAHGAGGRYYNTPKKITARVGVIAKQRRVASCLHTSVTLDEHSRPALAWHFDQHMLDAQTAADGWYALITNRTTEQATAAQVLLDYKGQGESERLYGDFKGPLAVTPVFVQHNRRIAALIQVICLALLVFCLIERQVRRALGHDQTMNGLYPDNRRVRPTGRMILYHLGELWLRTGTATDPPTVVITRGVQVHLLDLLGIEVTHPRWPQT